VIQMSGIPDESVDAVVTRQRIDMLGPDDTWMLLQMWIGGGGAPVWQECFRTLKPGGHLACIVDHWSPDMTSMAIRLARFEIRDVIGYVRQDESIMPRWTPIILARKPLAGTVAENVRQHGVGALNINATRIPLPDGDGNDKIMVQTQRNGTWQHGVNTGFKASHEQPFYNKAGRWPANVIHDASPQTMAAFGKYGDRSSKPFVAKNTNKTDLNLQFMVSQDYAPTGGYADGGNVARFFFSGSDEAVRTWITDLILPPGGVLLDPFEDDTAT